LHGCGYIHYDLKPDNLLLRSGDRSQLESSDIVLIDFGVSKPFLDDSGEHLPLAENVPFSGNLMFQSQNAFKLVTLSRRDDLISLCYLMTFFFNGCFEWIEGLAARENCSMYSQVKKIKEQMTPEKMCVD
jgi:serine/threonine protein kinase